MYRRTEQEQERGGGRVSVWGIGYRGGVYERGGELGVYTASEPTYQNFPMLSDSQIYMRDPIYQQISCRKLLYNGIPLYPSCSGSIRQTCLGTERARALSVS